MIKFKVFISTFLLCSLSQAQLAPPNMFNKSDYKFPNQWTLSKNDAVQAQPSDVIAPTVIQTGEDEQKIGLISAAVDQSGRTNELTELRKELYAMEKMPTVHIESADLSSPEGANYSINLGATKDTYHIKFPNGVEKEVSKDEASRLAEAIHQVNEFKQFQVHAKSETMRQSFVNKTVHFVPETLTFFVAVGAVTFNTMWIKSHGDPLAMEKHIMSLKDPISHISFYSFMQANGFYVNFHTNRIGSNMAAMDPFTRNAMLKRLSYQGLAVGSLASSIVSDLGQSVQMCVDKWFKGQKDEESLQSCNDAWKQWTVRKKFTQYFPQIISLWSSQAITELIEKSATEAFSTISKKAAVESLKKGVLKMVYKIRAADVVLTCIPGAGWGSRVVKLAGAVTRIGLFIAVDQVVTKYLNRPLNNLIIPATSVLDVTGLNTSWRLADKSQWNNSNLDEAQIAKFEKSITSYTADMQQWRGHLNETMESDFSGWMEMTKKILNQVDYAHKFYSLFTETLREYLNTNYKVLTHELDKSALNVISGYPFRTLPFYGVSISEDKKANNNSADYYLLSPNELEKYQKQHILSMAKKFSDAQMPTGLSSTEVAVFHNVVTDLRSGNTIQMARGLGKLDEIYRALNFSRNEVIYGEINTSMSVLNPAQGALGLVMMAHGSAKESRYSESYANLMMKLRNQIGAPQPVMYPLAAFAQAVDANSLFKTSGSVADYDKWSIRHKYFFNKASDVMTFNILCGKTEGSLNRLKVGSANVVSPEFAPPTLLKNNLEKVKFCESFSTTKNLYRSQINGFPVASFLANNFDYGIIKNVLGKEDYEQKYFDQWWAQKVSRPINKELEGYDIKFREIVLEYKKSYLGQRSVFTQMADKVTNSTKSYFHTSVRDNLKAEANVYLQLINRTLLDNATVPFYPKQSMKEMAHDILWGHEGTAEFDYILEANKLKNLTELSTVYKKSSTEMKSLYVLFNQYHQFIELDSMSDSDFDKFIELSQKVDQAINQLLVFQGYKKVKAGSTDADLFGSENTMVQYENIAVKSPSLKQRIAVVAIKGLRSVEAEMKKLIRMKVALKNSLEAENKEMAALMGMQ